MPMLFRHGWSSIELDVGHFDLRRRVDALLDFVETVELQIVEGLSGAAAWPGDQKLLDSLSATQSDLLLQARAAKGAACASLDEDR